ncbi:MAG: hypothetical protein BRD21_07210 [Halobacteriales archaeon SW_8_66_22]|nr:MAG: hypothetical protein BRD21_07210 [Halobacteriales archaeon SW_8_66_22]
MDDRYPDDWNSRSRKVKKRDGYTCQNCGAKGGPKGNNELHAHHIVPISDGGSHKKSNLKTLCKDCHNAIHHKAKIAPTEHNERNENNGVVWGSNFQEKYYNDTPSVDMDVITNRIHPHSKPQSSDPVEILLNKIKERLGFTSGTETATLIECSNCGTRYENSDDDIKYICPSCSEEYSDN